MNTRLVVYRKETSGASSVTPFELDLEKAPNVRINYNWLDIKEPDQRKSNFSQTIKIPFTNRNNTFFENWFDVNLDSLVYNTKTKFKAVILVDSIPQLEGYIQLKSIYLNARIYEVVVFGDTANFFADIKGKKLRDAFIDDDVVDRQLDHFNTASNIVNSWGTAWGSGGLTTVNGVTDNDVMYPIIDYGHTNLPYSPTMFWSPTTIDSLAVDDTTSWNDGLSEIGAVRIADLKPSIRLQRLFHIIIQKAGYYLKSSFLGIDDTAGTPVTDTQWFSRLFMTLAPQYSSVRTKVYGGFEYTCNSQSIVSGTGTTYFGMAPNWNNTIYDTNGIFGTGTTNQITIPYEQTTPSVIPQEGLMVIVEMDIDLDDQDSGGNTLTNWFMLSRWRCLGGGNLPYGLIVNNTETYNITTQDNFNYSYISVLPTDANTTWQFEYMISSGDIGAGQTATSTLNSAKIRTLNIGESSYVNGNANAEVVMAENMPDLTQGDFVKDLVNRFNLIVQVDKDNPNLLLIEPYDDYIATGTNKYWTDKLDVSKEQVIKSTNEMQSKELNFTDLEDKDYFNNSYFKQWNAVWGSKNLFNRNDFAQKEFKNFSIYSPFIANGLNTLEPGATSQVAIASIFEVDEESLNRKPIEAGKPKLFYYSGTPITIAGTDPLGTTWDFNVYSSAYTNLSNVEAYSTNNKFPLCTQYNLDNLTTGITADTKILNWTYYNPFFSTGFTTPIFGDTLSIHGLYIDYWSRYINQIYSDEARVMECNLNLNEDDIFNFNFADNIYIKNTLWRVLSISNYVVGGKETTKVKLLKVIDKLSYECTAVPSVFNTNGTITFVNPENPTGGAVTVTNACCEDIDNTWTFQQTNNSTGVGTCYHNQNTPTSPNDISDTSPTVYGDINGNEPNPSMMPMPIMNSVENTIMNRGYGTAQSTTFFMYASTYDTATATFGVNGLNLLNLRIAENTMASLEIELMGTVQIDIGTPANVGKVGYYNYTTLLKNIQGTNSSLGLSGGILTKSNADSGFPTPTAGFTNFDTATSTWKPTIAVSGSQQIGWIAKVKIFIQPIPQDSSQFRDLAIYQNAEGILFQDLNRLEWN